MEQWSSSPKPNMIVCLAWYAFSQCHIKVNHQKEINTGENTAHENVMQCDGLSPRLFKQLPVRWILTLTAILHYVFAHGYPTKWAYSRLSMLLKERDFMNCNNYRGISVINCISKIYDYILYNRLAKRFTPHREQAGARPKRGCIEHIVTLLIKRKQQ